MQKRYIVTATPPTPNGDFHVGHLAGPYLGADLFARFQRMRGNDVVYVSSSDRNQSYVVTTAERLGIAPERLASDCHREMVKTLAAGRISVDAFNAPDTAHRAVVEAFFSKLEARGHVKRKTRRAPYSPGEGRHLFESYLSGFCPTCWAATAGAICETCGHPNDAGSLELPAARSGGVIEFVETEVAVLELESFRDRFEAFYAEKRGQWRPHLMEFVEEMLARPLPDYPLTYVSQWGIPAPFPGLEGQVLNVWAEMLPGLMNSTREACKAADQHAEKGLAFWHKDDGAELVQFLGYDNAFFFAFVHLALTWGVGETITPDAIVTNEFFELDNFKFSTSKNHLIWVRELLKERDVDQVRFYLALANPEHQKMNFTWAAMDMLVETKFSGPVVAALHALAGALDSFPEASKRFELDASIALRLDEALARFARFYAWESFSPQRVAEHLTQLLTRIEAGAKAVAGGTSQSDGASGEYLAEARRLVGLVGLVLPIVCQPLMPDFSDRLARLLGLPQPRHWPDGVAGLSIGLAPDTLRHAAHTAASFPVRELRKVS